MVVKGEVPHLANFSRVSFKPGEVVAEHFHKSMTEIMLVEGGSGIMKIKGVDYPVSKGMCITVSPNEKHAVSVTGSEDPVLLVVGVEE